MKTENIDIKRLVYFTLINNGNRLETIKNYLSETEIDNKIYIELTNKLEKNKINWYIDYKYLNIIDLALPYVIFYIGDKDKIKNDNDNYGIWFNKEIPQELENEFNKYYKRRFISNNRILFLDKNNIKVLTNKKYKTLIKNNGIIYSPFGLLENDLVDRLNNNENTIFSDIPFNKEEQDLNKDSIFYCSIVKELFLPYVIKDVDSYKFLCATIDAETKTSTLKTSKELTDNTANNFLIQNGSKQVNKKLN